MPSQLLPRAEYNKQRASSTKIEKKDKSLKKSNDVGNYKLLTKRIYKIWKRSSSFGPLSSFFSVYARVFLVSSCRIEQGCPAELPSMEIILFVYQLIILDWMN